MTEQQKIGALWMLSRGLNKRQVINCLFNYGTNKEVDDYWRYFEAMKAARKEALDINKSLEDNKTNGHKDIKRL